MSNQRKLAAILFADIAGYSKLMQENEPLALTILNSFKSALDRMVPDYGGQIDQYYGDGCLATFISAHQAVQCASQLQKEFNSLTPVVPVRIGLHSGEVIYESNNVFGDSINIASRIESMGVPGSILLSKVINDQVKNKGDFKLTPLGSFEFKNIYEPQQVFALTGEGLIVPKKEELKGKFAEKSNIQSIFVKPWIWIGIGVGIIAIVLGTRGFITGPQAKLAFNSIAVLPFDNLNNQPDQQYFSHGIAQDILTHLTAIQDLKVISFNSSKKFNTQDLDEDKISSQLGVRHLLTGNVAQSNDKLRVRVHLVDAAEGKQVYSEYFDRMLDDVFAIQTEVAKKVAQKLSIRLTSQSQNRIEKIPTENLEAYRKYSKARSEWGKRTFESQTEAIHLYQQAIELDPQYANAYSGIGLTYISMTDNEFIQDKRYGYTQAKIHAEKALRLDPENSDAYAALGLYYTVWELDFNQGAKFLRQAIEYQPNNAVAFQWLAESLAAQGDLLGARNALDKAKLLDPQSRAVPIAEIIILIMENKVEEAIALGKSLISQYPNYEVMKVNLFVAYMHVPDTGNMQRIMESFNYPFFYYACASFMFDYTQDSSIIDELNEAAINEENTLVADAYRVFMKELQIRNGKDTSALVQYLEKAIFDDKSLHPLTLQSLPLSESLINHPKFQDFASRRKMTFHPR